MKDLAQDKECFGLNISRDCRRGPVWLDQKKYISDTLEKFNLQNCNPVKTSVDPNRKLNKAMSQTSEGDKEKMHYVLYVEAVGRLFFISQTTRPDIST